MGRGPVQAKHRRTYKTTQTRYHPSMRPLPAHFQPRWLRQCLAIALFLIAQYAYPTVTLAQNTIKQPSFAFFYGKDIPWESLGAFDYAVVESDHIKPLIMGPGWVHRLNPNTQVAAYIAVGEVHPTRRYFKDMRPEWILGENKDWGSIVVDQAAPGWSAFYVANVVKPLWDAGYKAFFLDTLDSFYLVAKTPEAQAQQIAGMAQLIRDIKAAYPDAKLIFNRGFEILPAVHKEAFAVVAESLFQGWNAGKKAYVDVPQADRDWIWGQLKKCKEEYGLPVVSIDYVAPKNRKLARETAKKIRALGVIPWVTNPALDMMGVGQVEVLPRQVLAIHDEPGHLGKVSEHEIHRIATAPLNYLGMDVRPVFYGSPELAQITSQPLVGRYAGVLTWFNRGTFPDTLVLKSLVNEAREQDVPLVIVGALPEEEALGKLGMVLGTSERVTEALSLDKRSEHVGFEIEPKPTVNSLTPLILKEGTPWLRVTSRNGRYADVIAMTPWGGYAVDRYWKVDLSQDKGERWAVNPIGFFRAALRWDGRIPMPDVTTENGKRLLTVHIDGDGFASRAEIPGTPMASEVMLSEFVQRYPLPTTVSIIEGEVGAAGLYAALSPSLQATARKLYALPHVEVATHTFSHPFFWADAELGLPANGRAMGLRVANYQYSAEREVKGSADYINANLAPKDKKTKVILWSGNTQPLEAPIREAYQHGLLNMNSGNTWISKADPSLTLVGPIGMMKGEYFQVYAPNQNENVYTNDWTGPFYGYERVIETFEMTDAPQRMKPVNIYYHTYIASKRASINSLHKVYQWAMAQDLHPLYSSQYMERAIDWRRATVAIGDGGLELRAQTIRQWRTQASAPVPSLAAAQGIAGYNLHLNTRYIHTMQSIAHYDHNTVTLAKITAKNPYLESANAQLLAWSSDAGTVRASFNGYAALRAKMYAPACTLDAAQSTAALRASRDSLQPDFLNLESARLGQTQVLLRCAG